MAITLRHWDESRDGPLNERAVRTALEALGYSTQCYLYPPGTVFPEHSHGVDKIDAVLSGQFRLSMAGESVILQAGDWIEVPREVVHRAEVVGDESVVSIDAVRR